MERSLGSKILYQNKEKKKYNNTQMQLNILYLKKQIEDIDGMFDTIQKVTRTN